MLRAFGRFSGPLGLSLLFLLVAGCGERAPKFVKVSGTLSYKGEPLPGLVVNFVPTDGGPPSSGMTDEQGSYKLFRDRKTEGVVLGAHKVSIAIRPRNAQEESDLRDGIFPASPKLREILEKFGSQSMAPLQYEVTKDGQVIDINLE